jgi:hypothetical protein
VRAMSLMTVKMVPARQSARVGGGVVARCCGGVACSSAAMMLGDLPGHRDVSALAIKHVAQQRLVGVSYLRGSLCGCSSQAVNAARRRHSLSPASMHRGVQHEAHARVEHPGDGTRERERKGSSGEVVEVHLVDV